MNGGAMAPDGPAASVEIRFTTPRHAPKVAQSNGYRQRPMIRFTTQVEDRELVAAVHALGRERVKRLIRLLLLYKDDQVLLEECADMVLEELERRASSERNP